MTEIREKVSRLLNFVNEYGDFCIEPEDYMDFVHLLIQALDKAEADTKRLDWIDEKIDNLDICGEGDFYIMINEALDYENIIRADNIRDLIDKANNADNNL